MVSKTWVDLVRRSALERPGEKLYSFLADGTTESATLTCGELDRRARGVAARLREVAPPGARVVILCPPGLDYIVAFFACMYAGMVAVTAPEVSSARAEPRVRAIVDDAGASAVVTPAAATFETTLRRVHVEDDGGDHPWRAPAITDESLALLQYTSGSTARPRGVMLTHRNMLANAEIQRRAWRLGSDSVGVSWLPLYHDLGVISCLLQPVYARFPTFMMPPAAFLQRPARWLEAISRYRGTFAGGPCFAFELCVRKTAAADREGLDLSSWTTAFNGAEPVRAETLARFTEAFASCGFRADAHYPCYGLAEANFVTGSIARREPLVRGFDAAALERGHVRAGGTRVLVSCGATADDHALRIVDPEGRVAADGAVGEIWVGGPSVAVGYYGREEDTRDTFGARLGGEGPFLRTGDLGFVLDGELFITGRKKDLVIVRGLNHYPQDIELTVERVDPRLRAGCGAAFSLEDDCGEQVAIAHEMTTEALDPAPLFARIREAIAEHHGLEVAAIALLRAGTIPKTTSGKIQRGATRAAFVAGTLDAVAVWRATPARSAELPARGALEDWLAAEVARRAHVDPATIDRHAPFARFGLDSLAVVELSAQLQAFLGRPVSPTIAYRFPTIHELARGLAAGERSASSGEPGAADEPIAIVGIGCRFPSADGPEGYWAMLRDGVDAISEVPPDRWSVAEFYDPDPAARGKTNTKWGGFLRQIDEFDPLFFGISPREAAAMDPQQRLLLEVAWEALEDAGIDPSRLAGSATGVFVGITTDDYGTMMWRHPDEIDTHSATGKLACIAANRISYVLDLRGPSLAIDTACSASLVAVHYACESIRRGECTAALVGGVNVMIGPENAISQARLGGLAPDGRCKAFDASANGIVRGEGAGIVVLKPLSRAQADGDRIYAVVRGSAVNQDGRSNGLTAPNPAAQEAVLRQAYRRAGISPGRVDYVEAHGTGTPLGDPIEVNTLGAVLSEGRAAGRTCALGSVKTNFGHTEAAAGIAGVIKVSLSLSHRSIPPSLHFREANPRIAFDRLPLRVQTALGPWPEGEPPIAGVSGFGIGGTNAHVVLQGVEAAARLATHDSRPKPRLLAISARSPEALKALAHRYQGLLAREPLSAVARAACVRRGHLDYRAAIVASTASEAVTALDEVTPVRARRKRLVFVFSGQGSQWAGMARELYEREPAFREALDRCDRAFAGRGVAAAIAAGAPLERTEAIQPAVFAVQVALAATWRAWGIAPDAVVGHSLGEAAAAHVAGALSLQDAARVVVERSRLLAELGGRGAMLVVGLSLADARRAIGGYEDRVSVALSNGPRATVLSGEPEAVRAIAAALAERDVFVRALDNVDGAGHSPQVDPLRPRLVAALAGIRPRAGEIAMISAVTAAPIEGTHLDAAYWGRNLREPVLFADAVEALAREGHEVFVEIGPHPILAKSIEQTLGSRAVVLPSMRRDRPERETMLASLATLYAGGADVDFEAVGGAGDPFVRLPTYPWQRRRCWQEFLSAPPAVRATTGHPLLGAHVRSARGTGEHYWEVTVSATSHPFMRDHQLHGEIVFNSLAYTEMILAAARESLDGEDWAIVDLAFHKALFVPDEGARVLQLVLAPDRDGASFQLSSRPAEDDRAQFVFHLDGRLAREPARAPVAIDPEVAARCTEEVAGDDLYGELALQGNHFGPHCRGLLRARRGDREALADVRAPEPIVAELDAYRFHPALLDACGHALLVAAGGVRTFLPVKMDRVRVTGRPTRSLRSHARLVDAPAGTIRGDIRVWNDAGDLVAEIEGVTLQLLDELTPAASHVVYELAWREVPLRPGSTGARRWFVVGDRGGVAEAFAKLRRERGESCAVGAVGDVEASLAGDVPLDVVYLAALDRAGEQAADPLAGAADCAQVATLARVVARSRRAARISIATRGAQVVDGSAPQLAQAPLWGFGRTLAAEHPAAWNALVDLDPEGTIADCARALADELDVADAEDQIALRGGRRYVARLARRASAESRVPVRADATYLVTGGLGGIGLVAARWLVDRGARRLVLAGRTAVPPRSEWAATPEPLRAKLDAVRAIEVLGASVHLPTLDVSDEAQLGRYLRDFAREGWPPIRGAIHAAAVENLRPVVDVDAETLARDFAPKAHGAWLLHRLLGPELDWLVFYSSMTAVLASPLLASYAAANAFVDALAHHRKALGLPALSIGWGMWRDVGLSARLAAAKRRAWKSGGLDPARALRAQAEVFDRTHTIVTDTDWAEYRRAYPAAASASILAELIGGDDDARRTSRDPARLVREAVPEARSAAIVSYVRGELAAVLRLQAERIDLEQRLDALGLDSLGAVELRAAIEAGLGVSPPLATFLKGPTVTELAARIAEHYAKEG